MFKRQPLGFPWPTRDPFLFCVHHLDRYPAGNTQLGVDVQHRVGRQMGMDFDLRDGFRMYHGQEVPGFPAHPHRGFETITLARRGYIDHSDSLGAKARFGQGDVQWMTAGQGIVHSEMFPLLNQNHPNINELFQIWLNLPAKNKLVAPHFSMLWAPTIPKVLVHDPDGRTTVVTVMAGHFQDSIAPPPPPKSWASEKDADISILTLEIEPSATITLEAAQPGSRRTLYFFAGDDLSVNGIRVEEHSALEMNNHHPVTMKGPTRGEHHAQVLVLQGRPIGEPVAHHGPFVMNTWDELVTAQRDYQNTGFGGWPWPKPDLTHGATEKRFAIHPDERKEAPTTEDSSI